MADQHKLVNDQKHMCREQQMPRDDFISFAQANANYCYQLSLWWWSVCNQHRNNPFLVANQGCECLERSTGNMTTDEGYNSCPDRNREDNMLGAHGYDWNYACKDCPQPDMHNFVSSHWSIPSHEHLSTDRNVLNEHLHSMIFQQNDSHELSEVEFAASGDVLNVSNDDDDDDDDDDVEIDDDFRKFLEQSERHRQERDKRKQEALDTTDDYIEVGSAHLKTTTCAPSEQPGAKRKEEMKALYGKHVSTIMSLEASLQLNYDKNCDIRQPVFWPSIPLKF